MPSGGKRRFIASLSRFSSLKLAETRRKTPENRQKWLKLAKTQPKTRAALKLVLKLETRFAPRSQNLRYVTALGRRRSSEPRAGPRRQMTNSRASPPEPPPCCSIAVLTTSATVTLCPPGKAFSVCVVSQTSHLGQVTRACDRWLTYWVEVGANHAIQLSRSLPIPSQAHSRMRILEESPLAIHRKSAHRVEGAVNFEQTLAK